MDYLKDPVLRKNQGRYYACFYDRRRQQEKWVYLHTSRKPLAERRISEIRSRFEKGRFDPYQDNYEEALTIEEAIDRWTDWQTSADLSQKTIDDREAMLTHFAESVSKRTPVAQILPEDCQSWIYRKHSKTGKELSPHTKLGYYNRLNAFFSWCVEYGHIVSSPLEEVEKPRIPSSSLPDYLTREEVDTIIRSIEADYELRYEDSKVDYLIWMVDVIEVAVQTGLRRGELVNQRWIDTDLEEGYIRVRSYNNTDIEAAPNDRQFHTKWDSDRRVPLSQDVTEILKRFETEQRAAGTYQPFTTVFKGPRGGPLGAGRISKNFRTYRRHALPNRDDISFHSLRDTFASWMVQSGTDLYTVKEILGHRNITTTQKYAHLAPEHLSEAVRQVFDS